MKCSYAAIFSLASMLAVTGNSALAQGRAILQNFETSFDID
jgi:hypothetical protein